MIGPGGPLSFVNKRRKLHQDLARFHRALRRVPRNISNRHAARPIAYEPQCLVWPIFMTPASQALGKRRSCPNRMGRTNTNVLLRRQIRLRDYWTIDDCVGRAQTADIGVAGPWRIDRGAGEEPFTDQRLLLVHRVDAMHLAAIDGRLRPHADMSVP